MDLFQECKLHQGTCEHRQLYHVITLGGEEYYVCRDCIYEMNHPEIIIESTLCPHCGEDLRSIPDDNP